MMLVLIMTYTISMYVSSGSPPDVEHLSSQCTAGDGCNDVMIVSCDPYRC